MWDSDYRNRQGGFEDMRSERSTSAPPPETTLYLGSVSGNSYLGSRLPAEEKLNMNTVFENRNRGRELDHSLFSESNDSRGRASVPGYHDKPPPGFSSDIFSGSVGGSSHLGQSDRQWIGENLTRSRSAAPTFDGGFALGLPPGLANRETPLSSNRSGDSYLEPALDNSHILQFGERRPASTGVIGGSQSSSAAVLSSLGLGSSSGAVRPAAKTLMDLIQEDFPPESPLYGDSYGINNSRENAYLERPRTTSPLSQPRDQQFMYGGHDEISRRDATGSLTDSFDRFQIHQGGAYNSTDRPNPRYAAADRGVRPQGESRVQGSIYAPVAQQSRPQPHGVLHLQQAHFEQQAVYNSQTQVQPHLQQHVQTQVLPSGHTVYVNAPPQPYGYPTVQYHPHPHQHHIVHQTVPSGMPPHAEQYISVVPIQGGGAPGATYAYWQPEGGQPGAPQTLTILNPHGPGGVPVAVTRVRNTGGVESPRQQQNTTHGGRGKEKGGKGRRGGGARGGRGGGDAKQQTNSLCSPLLEEFKAKKIRDWRIYDIKGHVVEFCQDQNGSRFIQQRLEVGDAGEKEIVMNEVLPTVRRLRNDVFGNYVVQKLLDFGTPRMIGEIRDTLEGEMLQIALQMYGCRVVQKALETLDETDLPRLLKEFHNNVLNCIHDQNGNHVIQKCIEVMSDKAKNARADGEPAKADFYSEQIDFIVDDVLGNIVSLSCHPYGCRVLQRILEHCVEPKKSRALDEISKYHKTLLDDQYGNYVIQHVLQFGRHSDRDSIFLIVVENGLLTLSRQKFASNVVEKLLKYGTAQQRKAVVREMLKVVDDHTGVVQPAGSEGTSVVLLMVRDAYANYVVQTTLDVIPECEEKRFLMEELNAHSTELKTYTFAKHIVTKLA